MDFHHQTAAAVNVVVLVQQLVVDVQGVNLLHIKDAEVSMARMGAS